MKEKAKKPLNYLEAMHAIGHFIEQEHLSEVSVLEYKDGWIIHGITFHQTAHGFVRVLCDHVLSHNDVHRLQSQLENRGQVKRRWL